MRDRSLTSSSPLFAFNMPSSSIHPCFHSSLLACGFVDCCSSKICNVTSYPNSCSSSMTVNVTFYRRSDCDFFSYETDSDWSQCSTTSSRLIGDSPSCCMNTTSQCANCSQEEPNQNWFLILDPGPEGSPHSPTSSQSASSNATNTSGEAILTSTTKFSATPTSSTAQSSATHDSVSGSQSTTTTSVGQPVSPDGKSSNAAVAGGVAGGVVALALLLAILLMYCRRRTTGPLQGTDRRQFPIWGSGQTRPIKASGAELQEIKQGPSPTSSLLHPPSSWPLPPPPGYTPYRPHDSGLDRSQPNVSQPAASSPHTFDTHPPPESPPSPPPLHTRSSQDFADDNSEAQSVSPISSHYQRHPFDESEDLKARVCSEISSNDLFHTENKRS